MACQGCVRAVGRVSASAKGALKRPMPIPPPACQYQQPLCPCRGSPPASAPCSTSHTSPPSTSGMGSLAGTGPPEQRRMALVVGPRIGSLPDVQLATTPVLLRTPDAAAMLTCTVVCHDAAAAAAASLLLLLCWWCWPAAAATAADGHKYGTRGYRHRCCMLHAVPSCSPAANPRCQLATPESPASPCPQRVACWLLTGLLLVVVLLLTVAPASGVARSMPLTGTQPRHRGHCAHSDGAATDAAPAAFRCSRCCSCCCSC